MIKKLKLGILYKNEKIVNHRSLLKIFLNPILRYFGFYIGTKLSNGKLKGIQINTCKRVKSMVWDFNSHNEYDRIDFIRIFF